MDSRIAILGANGTGKSTLLHLITGALQPCEGTISKHVSLKLAKYSQHSADQLPYDKTPIEYLDAMYHAKFPEKDLMVCNRGAPLRLRLLIIYRPHLLPLSCRHGEHNLAASVSPDLTKPLRSRTSPMVCVTGMPTR